MVSSLTRTSRMGYTKDRMRLLKPQAPTCEGQGLGPALPPRASNWKAWGAASGAPAPATALHAGSPPSPPPQCLPWARCVPSLGRTWPSKLPRLQLHSVAP